MRKFIPILILSGMLLSGQQLQSQHLQQTNDGYSGYDIVNQRIVSLKDENSVQVYETTRYKILLELYLSSNESDKWFYLEKLKLLKKDDFTASLIKYHSSSLTSTRIANRNSELWLSVFSHDSRLLLVFIDDGFDGYVHVDDKKYKDNNFIDRIGFVYPRISRRKTTSAKFRYLNFTKSYDPDTKEALLQFVIPFPTGNQRVTLSESKYRNYFCKTTDLLEEQGIAFLPFIKSKKPKNSKKPTKKVSTKKSVEKQVELVGVRADNLTAQESNLLDKPIEIIKDIARSDSVHIMSTISNQGNLYMEFSEEFLNDDALKEEKKINSQPKIAHKSYNFNYCKNAVGESEDN